MVSNERIFDDIRNYWTNNFEFKKIKSRINILNKVKQKFGRNDVVAILTEWEEFVSLDYSNALIFDGRNILNQK